MQTASFLRASFQSLALCALALPAMAAKNEPPSAMYVEAVQLPAWVQGAGWRRAITPGSTVLASETVETGSGAGLVLSLPEGSSIRLGEKSKLKINTLQVGEDGGVSQVDSKLHLLQGFFRFATSAVSKVVGTRKLEVQLRTATAGVRGTDFWSMTDEEHDATCLFEGQVELATERQGPVSLAEPTAFWANFFDKPAEAAGKATPQQLQKFLSSTELQPGSGIATMAGKWRVVTGQYSTAAQARTRSNALQAAGYPSAVRQLAPSSYEVSIGRLASAADANAVATKVAEITGQAASSRMDR